MIRSLNEIVYDIIESYRATYKNTDSLDERLVATWIQHYRAELIKQRLEESMRIVDEHWVQDLGAIEMQPIDSSLVSGFTSDRYIMRSVREIPPTIQTKFGIGTFTRISPADRLENKFNLVSYERALYSGNGKYNNKDICDKIYDLMIRRTCFDKNIYFNYFFFIYFKCISKYFNSTRIRHK